MTTETNTAENNLVLKAKVASTGKDGKTYWHNIGRAFLSETKDGGFLLNIPSMNIVVMQPKENPDAAQTGDVSHQDATNGAEA
jgi:hypothetical protein